MRPRPSLPGYEVEVLIGAGPAGEVWRARDLTSRETVALQRLDEPLAPEALDVVRRNVELLRDVPSAHLVRVRAVVDDVLVLDHASGGSLDRLLARRRLSPGEVVTVVAPLAAALAAAHARGLVHGAISADSVRFSGQGMPLLSGLEGAPVSTGPVKTGRGGTADPGSAADPATAQDVWALAALCHHSLAGAPPRPREDAGQSGRTPSASWPRRPRQPWWTPSRRCCRRTPSIGPPPPRSPRCCAGPVSQRRCG